MKEFACCPSTTSVLASYASRAENLLHRSFGAGEGSGEESEIQQKKRWCGYQCVVGHDSAGRRRAFHRVASCRTFQMFSKYRVFGSLIKYRTVLLYTDSAIVVVEGPHRNASEHFFLVRINWLQHPQIRQVPPRIPSTPQPCH